MNWVLYAILLGAWWILTLVDVATLNSLESRPHPAVVTASVVCLSIVFLGLLVVLA